MAKKKGSGIFGTIRFFFILSLIALIGAAGLLFWQKDNVRAFIRSRIHVSPGKKSISIASVETGNPQGTLEMNVYNGLPVGATLTSLSYSVHVNNTAVCQGIQTSPAAPIAALATSTVKITFAVDSQKFRQAMAQAKPAQVIKFGQSVLDQLRGKKRQENSLQGMIQITGTAKVQIFFASIELPVQISCSL